jgi:hypothetical protein
MMLEAIQQKTCHPASNISKKYIDITLAVPVPQRSHPHH